MTDQSKSKPSGRIRKLGLESHAYCYSEDVRREIDALHDRIEALETQLFNYNKVNEELGIRVVKKFDFDEPKQEPMPFNGLHEIPNSGINGFKQEPKCEHDYSIGLTVYPMKVKCSKCGDIVSEYVNKPTEKKEKLADKLKNMNPRYCSNSLNEDIAKICIEAVEKVIESYDPLGGIETYHLNNLKELLRKELL